MTAQPTDADRQRAREIADANWPDGPGYEFNELVKDIAAAIAAARAEGWRDGVEAAAASIVGAVYYKFVERIRALKEPGHGG